MNLNKIKYHLFFYVIFLMTLMTVFCNTAYCNDDIDLKDPKNYFYDRYHSCGGNLKYEDYYNKSVAAFEKKDVKNTLFYLNNVLKYRLITREAFNLYGCALIFSGDYPGAEIFLKKAVKNSPEYKNSYMNLGLLFIKTEKWKALKEVSETYLSMSSTDFEANFGAGMAAYQLFDYREAAYYFDAAWAVRDKCGNVNFIDVLNDYRRRVRAKSRSF